MRLKNWVVTTLLTSAIFSICGLTIYVASGFIESMEGDNNSYVLNDMIDDSTPVINEINNTSSLSKPFNNDSISILTSFYSNDDTRENQEHSLILFENTYMPSTGVLYGSDNEFDVISIYQGEVIKIDESSAFGTTIEIKHDNDLISRYSSIKDVNVKVGDVVSAGELLGKSSENKVMSTCKNMLFLELIHNGDNINPEVYYGINLSEIK